MVLKYNYSKLKGRIIEKFDSLSAFSLFLGKGADHVSDCLVGRVKFTQDRIDEWCIALDIEFSDIGDYFFCHESSAK